MTTIREIAQRAGVSNTTVSRVLNGDSSLSVSPKTRERILATAEKLNYIPNLQKSTQNKGTIAVTNWYSKEVSILKREMFYGFEKTFNNIEELKQAIENYIEYYNHERIKTVLKNHTPIEYRNMILNQTI